MVNINEIDIETQENLEQDQYYEYDDSDVLEKKPTSKIVKKENFVDGKIVTILGVKKNKFGKPVIQIETDDPNLDGDLTLNNSNFNFLLDSFGNTPAKWKGQKIKVTSEVFTSNTLSDGFTLKLELI